MKKTIKTWALLALTLGFSVDAMATDTAPGTESPSTQTVKNEGRGRSKSRNRSAGKRSTSKQARKSSRSSSRRSRNKGRDLVDNSAELTRFQKELDQLLENNKTLAAKLENIETDTKTLNQSAEEEEKKNTQTAQKLEEKKNEQRLQDQQLEEKKQAENPAFAPKKKDDIKAQVSRLVEYGASKDIKDKLLNLVEGLTQTTNPKNSKAKKEAFDASIAEIITLIPDVSVDEGRRLKEKLQALVPIKDFEVVVTKPVTVAVSVSDAISEQVGTNLTNINASIDSKMVELEDALWNVEDSKKASKQTKLDQLKNLKDGLDGLKDYTGYQAKRIMEEIFSNPETSLEDLKKFAGQSLEQTIPNRDIRSIAAEQIKQGHTNVLQEDIQKMVLQNFIAKKLYTSFHGEKNKKMASLKQYFSDSKMKALKLDSKADPVSVDRLLDEIVFVQQKTDKQPTAYFSNNVLWNQINTVLEQEPAKEFMKKVPFKSIQSKVAPLLRRM